MDKGLNGFDLELEYYYSKDPFKGLNGFSTELETNLSREIFKGFKGIEIEFAVNLFLAVVEKGVNAAVSGAIVTVYSSAGNYELVTPASGFLPMVLNEGDFVTIDKCPFDVFEFTYKKANFKSLNYRVELETPPSLEATPVNELNLLRWYRGNGFSFPITQDVQIRVSMDCDEPAGAGGPDSDPAAVLPSVLLQEDRSAFSPLPMVFKDRIRFFINSYEPFSFVNFDDIAIGLATCTDLIAEDIGSLARLYTAVDPEKYFLYGEINVPLVKDGEYNLVIYYKAAKSVLFVSNPVRVINNQNWSRETSLLRVRNSRNIAGYQFDDLPEDFALEYRIDGFLRNEQTPENRAVYKDLNLRSRNLRFALERTVELELDYLDSDSHKSLALYLGFKTFQLDGGNYFQDGTYEREAPPAGSALSLAKVKLIDNDFSQKIKYC